MPGTTSVDGIVSGLKTTDIVEKLISLERRPIKILEDKRDLKNKKIAEWRTLNTKALALKDVVTKLRNFSNFSSKEATVSDSNVLSASAGGNGEEGMYSVRVKKLASNHQTFSKNTYTSKTAPIAGGTFQLSFDSGEVKKLSPTENTLTGLKDAINNSSSGAKASIIKVSNSPDSYRLYVTSNKTGKESSFSLHRLSNIGGLRENMLNVSQGGEDAEIEIGGSGSPITITSSSNNISGAIPGVSINLKKASPDTVVTLSVSATSSGAEDLVKEFVETYNDVIDFTKKQFSINPVTKKGGTLMGSSVLMGFQKDVRFAAGESYNSLSGSITSLTQIGVSSENNGKLKIDSNKLKSGIIDNGKDLSDFFVNGVAKKIGTLLIDVTTPLVGTIYNKTKLLESQVEIIQKSITRSEVYIARRKETLFEEFTRMEIAIGRLQNQGSFLSQQISTLNPTSQKK